MHDFKRRLNRYEELIKSGDVRGAIKRMAAYDSELLRMDSEFGQLIERIHFIDANMKHAIDQLQRGEPKHALEIIEDIKKQLLYIHGMIKRVAKREYKLEK